MKLTNEMVVPASLEEAWAVLLDVERIAPCLPGASIEGSEGDEYRGTMKLKLGPISSSFKGTIRIEEADEAARRAVLSAKARDSRGQGTAAATITSTMEPAEEGATRITVETDLRVTGPAASFGRGVMQDVSARLMSEFADCVAAQMGRPAEGAAGAGADAQAGASPEGGADAEAGAGPEAGADAEAGGAEPGADAAEGQAASDGGQGVPLAGPLPPDVPAPPPTEARVQQPAAGEEQEAGRPTPERRVEPAGGGGVEPAGGGGVEALDLGAIGREALMRRLAPVGAVALVLLLIVALLRRRSRT